MFAALFSFPKPVVAAINGHAIAGGCVLACTCDKRLMGHEVGTIGVTELLVGFPFPALALEIMRSVTPPHYFEDVICGAATYAPSAGVARGLVDEVVDPGLLPTARSLPRKHWRPFAGRLCLPQAADPPARWRVQHEGAVIDAEVAKICRRKR
jgi:enoyl-CoA hydratase